jgi:hypothetical protein
MADWIKQHEKRIKQALLLTAAGVFVLGFLLHGVTLVWPGAPIPERFIPPSFLAAITPAISVLLVYELLLLTLAVRGPFVVFVRREFEVISLIVLRELFKKMDELSLSDTVTGGLLGDVAIIAAGSIVLYFFVEVLERIERRFVSGALKKEIANDARWLQAVKNGLEVGLLAFFAGLAVYEGAGWTLGVPGTGFDAFFLQAVFLALIFYNVMSLFLTLLATEGYETLFEHSALVLASITVLVALPKQTIVAMPLIIVALLFVIMTLLLHGFARGYSMRGMVRRIKKSKNS